jgi:uncharacterized protein (TIGR01777 family)
MWIVITGASGFIGSRLSNVLRQGGHEARTLGRGASSDFHWAPASNPPAGAFENADGIVHLAGERVAQRWNPEVKKRIRDSRVAGTDRLIQTMSLLPKRPKVLVCASAVGYYGDRGDELLPEDAAPGSGFLPEVCREWEARADIAETLGLRVVKVRIGLVLGANGGALKEMLPPFKAGIGGRLGNGRQWMPWIHLDDTVGIFRHALENEVKGVLNAAAPGIVQNSAFTSALGKALHRPTLFPAPKFALALMFGEMADVMLGSQRAVPKATEASGYRFQYPELEAALASLGL